MMNPFTWFRRSRLNDVSDEIRSHIEEKTEVIRFIEYFNNTMAKPFKWTYKPLNA